jgi:hypothetical protein
MARVAMLCLHFCEPLGQGGVEYQGVISAPFVFDWKCYIGKCHVRPNAV